MLSAISQFTSRYKGHILKSFIVGADNFLVYRLGKKPLAGPFYVGWNLTFRCNCKCSFCRSTSFDHGNELNTQECLNIIRNLGIKKVPLLSLTGGEPLLRKDIYAIIRAGKKYGIHINVLTNGLLLESCADEILGSGLDAITISMDSASSSKHDSLRHRKGLFVQAERGIRKIKDMRRGQKPKIFLGVTISAENFCELDAIIDYWKTKVDEIIFQPIHDGFKDSIFKLSDQSMFINQEQRESFLGIWGHIKKKHGCFRGGYESEFPNYFFNRAELHHAYKCFAGSFMLQIDAYGNVYPCPDFIEKVGNLREEEFGAIWSGEKLSRFRASLKRSRKCFCWHRCTGPINYHVTKLSRYV